MSSFLVLLPLTLFSVVIALLVVTSPQIGDYVTFIAGLPGLGQNRRLALQIVSHVVAYAIMCFTAVATVRTVSVRLAPERRAILRYFQIVLEMVYVGLPSAVLIWLAVQTLNRGWHAWLIWLSLGIAVVGLVLTLLLLFSKYQLELFASRLRPVSICKADVLAALGIATILTVFASFSVDPVASAIFLGIFPVAFLAAASGFLVVAAIFGRRASPVAAVSAIVSVVLLLHVLDQTVFPTREFRYTSKMPPAAAATAPVKIAAFSVREVMQSRKILGLKPAFRGWLEHRRPAIEAYRAKHKAYPVFVVAAQGGGIYAAYHPALSLARLYDACPAFAHHLFGISSVSGGSLGAAVFADLLRSVPPELATDPTKPSEGCTPQPAIAQLEGKVQAFFTSDFLSPVIASAFVFDIPSLLVPQLRFGLDRSIALEYSLESAWRKLGFTGKEPFGIAANFYERWQPDGIAPALFMSATGVNYGIPVLISQIYWARYPGNISSRIAEWRVQRSGPMPPEVQLFFQALIRQDQQSRVSAVANVLDFRPDLQLATSTAIVLSARFPYITPPGNIRKNKKSSWTMISIATPTSWS
jgi:hypothetical protein